MPDHADGATGPLTGFRVLDISTMIAAPFSAALLADFGAEVIKVELPGQGDSLRNLAPMYANRSLYWSVLGAIQNTQIVERRCDVRQISLRLFLHQLTVNLERLLIFLPGDLHPVLVAIWNPQIVTLVRRLSIFSIFPSPVHAYLPPRFSVTGRDL